MISTTLKLFRALPLLHKQRKVKSTKLLKATLPYGFVFAPEILGEYNEDDLLAMLRKNDLFGINPQQINASFHKSWGKVKNASIEQLVVEQLVHYFTTYGFEALGIYEENSVYIPREDLEIPDVDIDKIKITIIRGYTAKQLQEKVIELLQSGIALNESTINDIYNIVTDLKMKIDPEVVKNKEFKIRLYELLETVPQNPVEFLRYVLYKTTGSTLIIKNAAAIEKIKAFEEKKKVAKLFAIYAKAHSLEDLSSIFLRFKPLFLAFRSYKDVKPMINRLRKLADTHHKPMPMDYLNEITAMLKRKEEISISKLTANLKGANIFRKIRLAYALKYRTGDFDSIQYKIRNGKAFATEFEFKNRKQTDQVLTTVLDSIVADIKKNVKGKKIYIPDHITYALPATEKQFTGFFPSGSYVTVPKDIIFGIHWTDVEGHRIDLDLSLINQKNKFGWDGYYRSENSNILFSGDMTSAPPPNGASELFYVQRHIEGNFIMFVNYYNYDEGIPVPYSIVIGSKQAHQFGRDFMLDPNTVLARAHSTIDKKQKLLGLLVSTAKECRFYFNESYLGNTISSSGKDYVQQSRNYLANYLTNMITLNELLKKAGAVFVDEKSKGVLSLAPEDLEKDTIIKLIK
jgi:hypothetical protein